MVGEGVEKGSFTRRGGQKDVRDCRSGQLHKLTTTPTGWRRKEEVHPIPEPKAEKEDLLRSPMAVGVVKEG